nr:hypothetical protein [Tanacetum cinerariifolium]
MDMTIDQQVALDKALVPHVSRLRIGKSNFRLRSDITSKESTLQLVYDVLRLTPFYKAFLVTTDVLEIYMEEFCATATVHHHSIRFKIDNMKLIVNLEYFREILHICPRLPGQSFDELPFEEEILAFLIFLGHSGEIRKLTDVNINKLHQPWRSLVAVINKYLSGKSTGYDSLRCSLRSSWSQDIKTQQFGVMLPVKLTNEDIKNFKAYKKYYAVASGVAPPKTKASVKKTKSSSNTTITPLTVARTRLSTSTKGKQHTKASKAKDEGTGIIPKVPDVPTEDSDDEDDDDDEVDERSDDQDDNDQDDDDQDEGINSLFETTPRVDVQASTTVVSLTLTAPTLPPSTIPTISQQPQAPTPPTTAPSTFLQDLPNFGSLFGFDHRLKTLESNFSEFVQTNQFARAVSYILGIVERYIDQRMNEAVKIINEHVKVQVSKILPKIEKTMNEQLKAKVLTRSFNSSKASYAVATDLSEMELKKILIEKIESNKSIHRFDVQRNIYKALIDAYDSDKIILDTYGDTVTLKRHRDDADKDEEPSVASDRGSKRRREGKEPESTSAPKEKATKTTGKSTQGSKTHQKIASGSAPAEEPMQTTQDLEEPSHQEFETATYESIQPWISDLAKQLDSSSSFNKLMETPVDFSAFLMNRLKVDTLTPELLAGATYELMKGSCKSLVELEFFLEEVYKATTDQLDWNNPEGQQYPHNLLKPLPLIPNSRGRHVIPFDHIINNDLEYLHGGASSRKYTTFVTKTKAADLDTSSGLKTWCLAQCGVKNRSAMANMLSVESLIRGANINSSKDLQSTGSLLEMSTQNVKPSLSSNFRLSNDIITSIWIGSRKADKSDDRRTLCFQHLSKNVYKKHRHPTTCGDLQLGVESYQKKLNLTKPDTYRSDLKRKEAYTAYSNPRGFIYQNKDKQNRLMRIDELYKFSDGMLNDV